MAHLAMMLQSDPTLQSTFEGIAHSMARAINPIVPEFPETEALIFHAGTLFGHSPYPCPAVADMSQADAEIPSLDAEICLVSDRPHSNHDALRKQRDLEVIISLWNAKQARMQKAS